MEVSSIAEQLYFTTTRVETQDTSGNRGFGTSFIFDYKSEKRSYPFLVTNKHVVSGTQKGRLTFIQSSKGAPLLGTGYRVVIRSFDKIWHGHPKANIDVTVTPLVPLLEKIKEKEVEIFFRSIGSELVLSKSALKQVDAIEDVVFVGIIGIAAITCLFISRRME